MGKGILLELEGRTAVVLTPEGEFKRVPAPRGNREVGAEVEFAETRPFAWSRLNLVAAAAVLLLLLAPTGYFGYNAYALAQPVALLSVDINPSLELTLNKQGDVLKGEGLNADGQAVLQKVDLSRRRPVADVVADVTQQAIAAGKLNPTDDAGAVLVAVAPTGTQELPSTMADKFADSARHAVEQKVAEQAKAQGREAKAHVAALEATAQEKQEATDKGLTPGQLLLLKEIQSQYPSVKPEDMKAMGPGKLIHSLNANPSEIFSKAEEHHGSNSPEQSKGKEQGKSDDQQKDKSKGQDKENGKSQDKAKEQSKAPAQGQSQEPANGKGQGKGQQGQGQGNRVETPSRGQDRSQDRTQEPKPDQGKGNQKEHGKSQSDSGKAGEYQLGTDDQNPILGSRAETPGAGASVSKGQGKKNHIP